MAAEPNTHTGTGRDAHGAHTRPGPAIPTRTGPAGPVAAHWNGRPWPAWLAVPTSSVSDLLMLAALRFDLDRGRYDAGVIEAVGWILETNPGPGTGRPEGPQSRAVAWCEMGAAGQHALEGTDRPVPPLRQVCAELGVPYLPPRTGDPEYGLGAYTTLRWALGETHDEPMRLPLRAADGHLLGVGEILPELLSTGMDPTRARAQAAEMAEDTVRLAELVRLKTATRS